MLKKILTLFFLLCFAIYAVEPPLIGITSDYSNENNSRFGQTIANMSYITAVENAGGIPVVLPTLADSAIISAYIKKLDGLVLVGGADIWPSVYGEKPHPTADTLNVERFTFEQQLIPRWLAECNKPILGICLGSQFTNVVLGGSLYQDIPSQVGSSVMHRSSAVASHSVQIEKSSRLYTILQKEQETVNSYHHQAVKQLAPGLRAVAHTDDGLIEATELVDPDRFGLFVQWHPERMDAHRQAIFGAFIHAAEK